MRYVYASSDMSRCVSRKLTAVHLQTQESNYMFLLSLQEYAISLIKEGAILKDVHADLVKKVRDEKPELEKHFVKTLGFTVSRLRLSRRNPVC